MRALALLASLADVFEKNETKNKTSVYRLITFNLDQHTNLKPLFSVISTDFPNLSTSKVEKIRKGSISIIVLHFLSSTINKLDRDFLYRWFSR